jgi:hypothetical protein
VYDVFRGQTEARRYDGFTRHDRRESGAGGLHLTRPRRHKYRAAHAATHSKLCIGGVYDGVDAQRRYVRADYVQWHMFTSSPSRHNEILSHFKQKGNNSFQIGLYCVSLRFINSFDFTRGYGYNTIYSTGKEV